MFGVGGVEQIWLWENATEKGICFGPRNILRKTIEGYGFCLDFIP